ncbi:MAG: hypothetical protein IKJ43_03365 [Bacilli bacterium]|nr:hypothetical protein [Bacilli bacterium]
MDSKNEIDISKVKEMIDSRENNRTRQFRKIETERTTEELPVVRKRYTEDVDTNYDIMNVLKEAKENKKPDNKERVLDNTNYDVLKKLNLNRKSLNNEDKTTDEKKEDLKELIETISNTSMLNKVNDQDLATDMFQDLISDDTKVGEIQDISEFMDKDERTMDDSFFTSKIRKADFENGKGEKSHPLKTFFIVLLGLAVLAGTVIFLLYVLGVIK